MQMYTLKLDGLTPIQVSGRYTQTNGWKHKGQQMPYHILVCVEEGKCVFETEGRQIYLAQNECIFVPANTFYAPRAIGTCIFKAFHFSAEAEKLIENKIPTELPLPGNVPTLTIPEKFKIDSSIALYLDKALAIKRSRIPEANIKKNIHFIHALVRISENATQACISSMAQEIKLYIDTHSDEDLSVGTISEVFRYSKQHITRVFKESFNLTPAKYILQSRLEKSLDFLAESRLAISEIAEKCGFKDLNYFSRQFKKIYGISPTAYRKKLGRRV